MLGSAGIVLAGGRSSRMGSPKAALGMCPRPTCRCSIRRSCARCSARSTLLADPTLARLDPQLASVSNLNEPVDYERARALPAPEIAVRLGSRRQTARAWSLGEVTAAVGLALDKHVVALINGDQTTHDAEMPLVRGDTVSFRVTGH